MVISPKNTLFLGGDGGYDGRFKRFGEAYIPEVPNEYKGRKNAQDAHEAIRPTDILRTPESIKEYLTRDQFNLYKLIYNRTIASQMAPALYETLAAELKSKQAVLHFYGEHRTFAGFTISDSTLVANYIHGSLQKVTYRFLQDGGFWMNVFYDFNGVVDLMGICFDYPEQMVKSKQWVGKGPYRVWQNRKEGPQYGLWSNDYNDPIPGESWEYPEFKGYFSNVNWMRLTTQEGKIGIETLGNNIGVYTPRDGRDHILYTLPETGISILKVIPAVRNKIRLIKPTPTPPQGRGCIIKMISK
mgnify:CR=1 FL=1